MLHNWIMDICTSTNKGLFVPKYKLWYKYKYLLPTQKCE